MNIPRRIEPMPDYAEIGITTNFSFLRGGSHPKDYVRRAGGPSGTWAITWICSGRSNSRSGRSGGSCSVRAGQPA